MKKLEPPEAVNLCRDKGSFGIAYTYNEPLINYEWISDASKLLSAEGLKNVLVTNGYINEEPLVNLLRYIDAANIDVKSFRNDFYKKVCSGELGHVIRTVEIMVKQGKHIELTYLVIPGMNDSMTEVSEFSDWVSSLDPEIPVHFSRYYPSHKMTADATPFTTMQKVRRTALKYLRYVYLGNVWDIEQSNTYCPGCGKTLIERTGYRTEITNLSGESRCGNCGRDINIPV